MKGKLIVVEGLDYTGKSSAIAILKLLLADMKADAVFTREPGGLDIKISEDIRSLIFESDNIDPLTEAYLFAASRAEHTKKIKEMLDQGKIVICDRYIYSSLLYQGIIKEVGEDVVFDLNKHAMNGIEPDMIFYFTATEEERKKRAAKRTESNRLDKEVEDKATTITSEEYLKTILKYKPKKTLVFTLDTTELSVGKVAVKMFEAIQVRYAVKTA